MQEIITQNPFRILGVCSNSPLREIVANRNRINAFSKVGKACVFPTDLTVIAGEPDRSAASVQQADSALTIDADKLRYAQFWLMKPDGVIEADAIKNANEGRLADAIMMLEPVNTVSAVQNQVVLNLLMSNIKKATQAFAKLFKSYSGTFLAAIELPQMPEQALIENYVSVLTAPGSGISPSQLMGDGYPAEWDDRVKGLVAQPLITELERAIEESRMTADGPAEQRLAAGRNLARRSKKIIMELRRILSTKDLKLVNVADKAGNEVLQCAIDYCNSLDSLEAYKAALPVATDAQMIVMGPMRKQRCDENLQAIKNYISQAPPSEVAGEVTLVQNAINTFRNGQPDMEKVKTLVSNTRVALNTMRSRLGSDNQTYLYWASAVVHNVLNTVIDIVNDLQNKVNEAPAGTNLARGFFTRYCTAVDESYNILDSLETVGMDAECRQRFTSNFSTLKDLHNQIHQITTQTAAATEESSGSKWGGCLLQVLVYAGLSMLFALCQ